MLENITDICWFYLVGPRPHKFRAMYDTVHIDEKWFNMYTSATKYYLTADEQLPHRTCPNKRYIGKVMFLAAVARPRYDYTAKKLFDGKIGIWPIVEIQPAKRSSSNRPAGTPETKNVSMTRSVYVKMLKEMVFPAIRAKWPGEFVNLQNYYIFYILTIFVSIVPGTKYDTIRVQQDNAGPHVPEDHAEVQEAGSEEGWRIEMMCQPPRSPDMNILDLGFFNAIQAQQYKSPTNQTDSLIGAVTDAFEHVGSDTLDKCFLTLQKVMETVVKHEGGNDYALPRVKKHHYRDGVAPTTLTVDANFVYNGYIALNKMSNL